MEAYKNYQKRFRTTFWIKRLVKVTGATWVLRRLQRLAKARSLTDFAARLSTVVS
jgi:hypothetical protein